MTKSSEPSQSSIKSVRVAFGILEVVARNSGPISLKMISRQANVSASKAHRYVQILCSCGLMSQAHKSGNYDLGLAALRIGLSAVNRVEVLNRAADALPALVDDINSDAFISVWSDLGPTVVRFERSKSPSIAMIGPGVAFPIFTTATGMIFLAFASPELLRDVLEREIKATPSLREKSMSEIIDLYANVKEEEFAYSVGSALHGRHCAAAPIFSLDDKVIAAVTFVSTDPDSVKPQSPQVTKLLEFCRFHSLPRSGYADETLIEQKIAV
jgi:DNA-binding IclR family transcriptional regulator